MSKQIHDYSAANSIDASADYLLIDPASSGVYKKINRNTLLGLASAPLGLTDSQSPTNKVFDNTNQATLKSNKFTLQDSSDTTKQAAFSLSGITTGNTRTITVPDASLTLVGTATTQTLTNKTLTSPTITGGTIDNSTITVDSISGHTSATTVTVANLQIANGVLNTANSVTATSIAAGAIQPQALVSGTGSGWAWSTWSPTWTNVTVGNGTLVSKYIQMGKTVFARLSLTFGTTSSVSGTITFSLPVTAASGYTIQQPLGQWTGNGGGSNFIGSLNYSSTTTAFAYIGTATSTYTFLSPTSSTVPLTWASTYTFLTEFMYEAA